MYFKILRVEGTSQVVFRRPVNHPGAYRPAWLAVQSQSSGHIISGLPRLSHWSSKASPNIYVHIISGLPRLAHWSLEASSNIYGWYLLGRVLSVVLQVPCLGYQELNPGLLHAKHVPFEFCFLSKVIRLYMRSSALIQCQNNLRGCIVLFRFSFLISYQGKRSGADRYDDLL